MRAFLVIWENVAENSINERRGQVAEQVVAQGGDRICRRAPLSLDCAQHEAHQWCDNRRTEKEHAPEEQVHQVLIGAERNG